VPFVGVLGDGVRERPVEVGVDVPDAGLQRALVRHDEFDGSQYLRVVVEESLDRTDATGLVAVDTTDDRELGGPVTELFDTHVQALAVPC